MKRPGALVGLLIVVVVLLVASAALLVARRRQLCPAEPISPEQVNEAA